MKRNAVMNRVFLKSFYTERGIFESELSIHRQLKVKVVLYTFVRKGVPVREETYPEPSACEVGWSVPFIAAFISPVLPPSTHSLLGEQ